jgi:hypothetical protein
VAERDFIRETAEINAHTLELVQMVEDDAEKAIGSRDVEELIGSFGTRCCFSGRSLRTSSAFVLRARRSTRRTTSSAASSTRSAQRTSNSFGDCRAVIDPVYKK